MNKYYWALFLGLLLTGLNAQNYDFGKVSKEELKEQFNPKDSTAEATILYRKERVYFTWSENLGFIQHREVQTRIKIYTKDGFDWANEKVFLYNDRNGNRETLTGLRGYTFNLENGKIEKDKMSSSASFKEVVSEYTNAESFTLPNVKEGSIIEYKYEVSAKFPSLDDFYFQFTVPVKMLEVSIETPHFFRYQKQFNPRAVFMPKYRETTKDRDWYNENIIKIKEENVPALKTESFAGNIGNYRAKLSMEIDAVLSSYGVVEKSFSENWENVCKTIYESNRFGGQLNRTGFFKNDLEALVANAENEIQKVIAVETLVKSKIKWNGSAGKYAQKTTKTAYEEGMGNVADMNLLVVAMLQSLGMEAAPVLVSTADNGIPLFPTRNGFNYVIAMVKHNAGYLLIDATEQYGSVNTLPQRVLNWKGRVVYRDKTSDWVNIEATQKSEVSTTLNFKILEDFSAEGKVKKSFTNHLAMNYRDSHAGSSEETHIESIESGMGDLEISELVMNNAKDPYQPLSIAYNYELLDGVDEVGGKLYFNPLVFLASEENPFKLDQREYPIDFSYPLNIKNKVNIMLPEGYKVESLPNSEAYAFKDSNVKFVYRMRVNGQYLQLTTELEINTPIILPSDYAEFKQFYSKIIEKEQEQVVLSKNQL